LLHIVGVLSYKIFSVLGNELAEFSLRLIVPICGALMLAYTYLISRKLFNAKIALYSVLLLTFIPDHIYHSSMFYPDILIGLLVTMGIYYILRNKIFLSGILIGLSFLTKYNALFAFPIPIFIIIYNNHKQKIKTLKKIFIFSITSLAIGSFWFIRNYILLGNPIYPLFNSLFLKSAIVDSWGGKLHLIHLISPGSMLKTYLSFFGVPDGYAQNLFFLQVPFIKLFLAIWFIGTALFILPTIIGLFKIKLKSKSAFILGSWLLPYLLFSFMLATSIESKSGLLSRYLIPIFPIIAILWAIGFDNIYNKIKIHNSKSKILGILLIILLSSLIIGFTSIEFTKTIVVKNSWNRYKPDFTWIEQNTPEDAKILVPGGECYSYNFNRVTHHTGEPPFKENLMQAIEDHNMNYIWVNQKDTFYGQEPGKPAVYSDDFIKSIETSFNLVYKNKITHTKVYKTNH
ncbi:MAG: glycosyltransferase family 39 protein, partial [Candidatus Woesearchaeota archaeon]|nr:glycosyltransferase family 39 protein [Candidatus Woesearchaeota archaeon]